MAALSLAVFILRYDMEQHFVVVLPCAGRVDAYSDMFEPLIFMEHYLNLPGDRKSLV